jgi:hypothetical protein
VLIEVHPALAESLEQLGKAVPQPVSGKALIDPGAGMSGVDSAIIEKLGIPPVGVIQLGTAGGERMATLHPARFSFPIAQFPRLTFNEVVACDLAAQEVIALIERDVLQRFLVIYDGGAGEVTIAI